MMNNYFKSSVKLLALLALIPCFITENFASERKVSMNENWKFYRGCIANAEQTSFKDTQWRELDLPHDWSMDPVPIKRRYNNRSFLAHECRRSRYRTNRRR
jgi:beta-galactosidase